MRLSLKGQQTAVFGLKGAGKSNWMQYVLNQPAYSASHVVYDVCREHDSLKQYIPQHIRGDKGLAEFDQVADRLITGVDRERRPEILALEEVSRYAPSSGKQSEAFLELIDLGRHYDVGLMSIARRPAKVHTDITELADQLVVFRLTGKNDVKRLNAEADGLGDAARKLDDYHYIVVDGSRNWKILEPVPEMDTTGKL